MSVPTMEELVEVFIRASDQHLRDQEGAPEREFTEVGLLAVLDRLKPVVAEAFQAGANKVQFEDFDVGFVATQAYATRIIDQIKGA